MSSLTAQLLEWDSQFFGLRIARLTSPPESLAALQGTMDEARRARIDCIYALVPANAFESAEFLQNAGFIARDVRLEFVRSLTSDDGDSTDVREWTEADVGALEDIAESAFTTTRFTADPGFSPTAVRSLYRTWIRNSCRGFAQSVLVTGPVGEPQGFITLHREEAGNATRIGLIGIGEPHRSRGAASRLIAAALKWASGRGCREIRVATQANNVGAQRLYQRNGFLTSSASTWYHGWPIRSPQSSTIP